MSNQESTTQEVSFVQQAIIDQKAVELNKNWKESQLTQARKARNKELNVCDNACARYIKESGITDVLMIANIKLGFEAEKLQIRAKHEPKIDALRVALEDITTAGGNIAGDAVGSAIAPVTKSVKSFWDSLKSRAL